MRRRLLAGGVWLGLSLLLAPLAILILPVVVAVRWQAGKSLRGFKAKCLGDGPRGASKLSARPIVVHGVSLGEINLLLNVLPQIQQALPDHQLPPICLSTSTATGQERLQHFFEKDRTKQSSPNEGGISSWTVWPLDLPWAVVRFFARVKPLAIILAELEIWPMMLLWAQVCRVPVIVLNARMSAKSRRGWGRTGPFGRLIFGGLRGALAQNHQWAARLSELGTPNVEVTGSLKADAVSEPSPEKIAACAEQFNLTRPGDADHQPTLLIASTAALADSNGGEEDIALRSWQQWGPDAGWHLIIAPRHPERGDDVAQEVRNVLGQETLIWQASRDQSPPPANAVRIIDQIGVLIALYALADLAIIGGGWGSGRGSQNMLEAAAAKCPAIVGPDYKNFPDIIPLLVEADALIQLDDPQDLDATLRTLAADPTRRQAIGERSYTTWQNNRGSVRRVAEVLPALFHEK